LVALSESLLRDLQFFIRRFLQVAMQKGGNWMWGNGFLG
jgi:hypothetical protein